MRAHKLPKSLRLYATCTVTTSQSVLTSNEAGAPAVDGQRRPVLAVLDTNVVLDLLVFADPRAEALAEALASCRMLWLATEAMFEELGEVLSRPTSARWCPDPAAVLAQARARCHQIVMCPPSAQRAPTCADRDDQIFIDLAWAWPVDWLFSRDRALLALDRPAQQRGLRVVTPARWPGSLTPAAGAWQAVAPLTPRPAGLSIRRC